MKSLLKKNTGYICTEWKVSCRYRDINRDFLSTIIFSRALSAYVGRAPQYRSFIVPSCLNYLIGLWHFTTPVNRHTRNTRESRFGNSRFVTLPSCFRFCKNATKFTARISKQIEPGRDFYPSVPYFKWISIHRNFLFQLRFNPFSRYIHYIQLKKLIFFKNDHDNYSYNLHLTVWSIK